MSDLNNTSESSIVPGVSAAPEGGYEQEVSLPRLWGYLKAGKWTIAVCVVAALLFGVFYLLTTPSVYVADALVQISPQDQSPLQGLTSDLTQLTGGQSSPAEAEISIIKSRSVVGKTVDKLGMTISSGPKRFPYIGSLVTGFRQLQQPASKPVGADKGWWLTHYAWKPTILSVNRFVVPEQLEEKQFTLRALGGGHYILFDADGKRVLEGHVDKLAIGHVQGGGAVRLFVSQLATANPPTDFNVEHRKWLSVVDGVSSRLQVNEQGEQTGIVRVALAGDDRNKITAIVNSVVENYLRQNVEAKSKKAQKSLAFLDKKMPKVKSQLDAAEGKLASYREKHQAVDLTAEGQALLQQASTLESQRSQLRMKMAELRQTYTGKHPALQAARQQMHQLDQSRSQLQSRINKLPNSAKHVLRLRRAVEVNTQLYTALLNRAQELRVMKAGTVGNVRIIDKAVEPVRAVSPKHSLVLMLSLVAGLILGCCFVFLRIAMRRGVDDPQDIENRLGMPVYAVVPFSGWLAKHGARARRHSQSAPILAREHGSDVSVEALRSLRTSLFFAQMDAKSNTILITGPAPGVGKSFISANLAYLLAETGKSVVVVDADMRKGRLQEFVNNEREPGLSQILTGQISLDEALRPIEGNQAQIITSGQLPPNPSELLMREEFVTLMSDLSERFDLVLVDAPPILAVTDAAVIAASAPSVITFMVVRAGMHPIGEVQEAIKRMNRNDRKVAGIVFNGYKQAHANYSGGYSYYAYEYGSGKA